MTRKHLLFTLVIAWLSSADLVGQDPNEQLREAQNLELQFRDSEALQKYLSIIASYPNNLAVVCKISELFNVLGKRQSTKSQQREYYRKAKEYADRALNLNPNSAEANFVMSIAMGRMALLESGEDKINAVRDIKKYAERSIQLDPKNFKSYHVLGKWYYEVSNLSSFERWLVKVAFGALPEARLEDAIRFYEKSRELNPTFLLNFLELAKAYKRKDDKAKAISLLNTLLRLPSKASDDAQIKSEAKKLIEAMQ